MGNFALKDFKYIYTDDMKEAVFIDFTDNLSNKGRIPFHSEFTDITVNSLILKNMDDHEQFCIGNEWLIDYLPYYVLMDVMVISEHIKSKYPKTVCEFGANDEVLCKHINGILKEMHPDSRHTKYVYPYNSECINHKGIADIALINGASVINDCEDTVRNALGSLKANGLLICFSIGQKELNAAITKMCGEADNFSMNKGIDIYTYRKNS